MSSTSIDKETAHKRIPRDKLVSLDVVGAPELWEMPEMPGMKGDLDAEQSFNYAWKAELLERVLSEVKRHYVQGGMETHWCVFRDRVLEPTLEDRADVSFAGQHDSYLGIAGEQAVLRGHDVAVRLVHDQLAEVVLEDRVVHV